MRKLGKLLTIPSSHPHVGGKDSDQLRHAYERRLISHLIILDLDKHAVMFQPSLFQVLPEVNLMFPYVRHDPFIVRQPFLASDQCLV